MTLDTTNDHEKVSQALGENTTAGWLKSNFKQEPSISATMEFPHQEP